METLKITKADLNERNEYARSHDLEFEGHIEIESSLGLVKILGIVRAVGGLSIKAGSSIKAGGSIQAGWSIEAGESIQAGWSIEAGWSIRCKTQLTVKLRIFAGLCSWRLPKPEEMVIECAELAQGTVCFGDLRILPATSTAGEGASDDKP